MKATKLIVAAGLALATTGVFAETGVKSYQIDSVTNIYGRAAVAAVQIKGNVQTAGVDVQTAGADVNNSGRSITKSAGSTELVTSDVAINAGRS